jgi:hypothetical protein
MRLSLEGRDRESDIESIDEHVSKHESRDYRLVRAKDEVIFLARCSGLRGASNHYLSSSLGAGRASSINADLSLVFFFSSPRPGKSSIFSNLRVIMTEEQGPDIHTVRRRRSDETVSDFDLLPPPYVLEDV